MMDETILKDRFYWQCSKRHRCINKKDVLHIMDLTIYSLSYADSFIEA